MWGELAEDEAPQEHLLNTAAMATPRDVIVQLKCVYNILRLRPSLVEKGKATKTKKCKYYVTVHRIIKSPNQGGAPQVWTGNQPYAHRRDRLSLPFLGAQQNDQKNGNRAQQMMRLPLPR